MARLAACEMQLQHFAARLGLAVKGLPSAVVNAADEPSDDA